LDQEDYEALVRMARGHEGKTANGLIGLLTDSNETVKWRAVRALGQLTAQMFSEDPEGARKVIRQLIWNLNEESGGIGWGMPEALGEILAAVPALREGNSGLLAAYLVEEGCLLENEQLQKGVIWGLGRLKFLDQALKDKVIPFLLQALKNSDLSIRGTAAWALGELDAPEAVHHLKSCQGEIRMVKLFINNSFQEKSLDQWVNEALDKLTRGGNTNGRKRMEMQ
jgi:HEAT repeat protein